MEDAFAGGAVQWFSVWLTRLLTHSLVHPIESDKENETSEEEEEEEIDEGPHIKLSKDGDESKNSQLAVGYKNQRSFVIRGDRIGVFKHGDEDLEFSTSINNITTPKGEIFSPAKVMLHDQDTSMIMFNPDKPNNLYNLDLEYGKIVDEWVSLLAPAGGRWMSRSHHNMTWSSRKWMTIAVSSTSRPTPNTVRLRVGHVAI